MSKKLRKGLIFILALSAAAAGIWHFFLREKEAEYQEDTARTLDIVTYYMFTGNMQADGSQTAFASLKGKIREWKIKEGSHVTKDAEVGRFESGTIIKSPMTGTVSDIFVDVGEECVMGGMLFRVANYDKPLIHLKVDEYDIAALSKGQAAEVHVLATGDVLSGHITHIAREATVVGDLAYYDVTVEVRPGKDLPMGMSCEVLLPRESAHSATTVSMNAIQYDEDGKPYVYCYSRGNEIVKQTVILGINDGSIVEIKEGIRTGETILIPEASPNFPMMMHR